MANNFLYYRDDDVGVRHFGLMNQPRNHCHAFLYLLREPSGIEPEIRGSTPVANLPAQTITLFNHSGADLLTRTEVIDGQLTVLNG